MVSTDKASPKRCKHGRVATAVIRRVSPPGGAVGDFIVEAEDYTCHHPSREIAQRFASNGCYGCPEFQSRDE